MSLAHSFSFFPARVPGRRMNRAVVNFSERERRERREGVFQWSHISWPRGQWPRAVDSSVPSEVSHVSHQADWRNVVTVHWTTPCFLFFFFSRFTHLVGSFFLSQCAWYFSLCAVSFLLTVKFLPSIPLHRNGGPTGPLHNKWQNEGSKRKQSKWYRDILQYSFFSPLLLLSSIKYEWRFPFCFDFLLNLHCSRLLQWPFLKRQNSLCLASPFSFFFSRSTQCHYNALDGWAWIKWRAKARKGDTVRSDGRSKKEEEKKEKKKKKRKKSLTNWVKWQVLCELAVHRAQLLAHIECDRLNKRRGQKDWLSSW